MLFRSLEAIVKNDAVLHQLKLLDSKAIKALMDLLIYSNATEEDIHAVFEDGKE